MTALLDTNVVLDVLLDRTPFVSDSSQVWQACDQGRLTGYVSATTLTTIYYVIAKTKDRASALSAIDACLSAFEIAPVHREALVAARQLSGSDFEDNLQIAAAATSFLDCIVTRNTRDFAGSPIVVYLPFELMKSL